MSVVVCFRVALVYFVNKSMVTLCMEPQEWKLKCWFSCLSVHYQIKCSFLNLRSLATYSATELMAHFLFSHVNHFPPQCWLTVLDLFSLFCLCVCREISVEKLNLEGTSPPKAEIRRDVVDAPAPLVSEWGRERGMDGCQRGGEAESKMDILKLSCYYFAHFLPEAFGLWTVLQS